MENWEKIRQLPTINDMLDEEYGKEGTPTRDAFNRDAGEMKVWMDYNSAK